MARRPITQEFYETLLAAFRDRPGNYANAARVAKCMAVTAKRAWEEGWPSKPFAPPIRQRLIEEEHEARAAAAKAERERIELMGRMATEHAEAVRADAVERRKLMLQVAKGLRGDIAVSVVALQRIGQTLMQMLATFGSPESIARMEGYAPATKVQMMREFVMAVRAVTDAYEVVDRIARLDDERPTAILGGQVEMTVEEAARTIDEANSLLVLMREEGIVLDAAALLPGASVSSAGGENGVGAPSKSNGTKVN